MDIIYVCRGKVFHGEKGYPRVVKCASAFADSIGISRPSVIKTHSKGKPYFSDSPMEFSLSHSDDLWACVYSEAPCGLDVQLKKEINYRRIGERIFSDREMRYLKMAGGGGVGNAGRSITSRDDSLGVTAPDSVEAAPDGDIVDAFYRLWTRTEAFAKCTGDGIFGERPELVGEDGNLLDIVEWKGNKYYFSDVVIDEGFSCALCQEGSSREFEISFEIREGL
ncbi:MAG: 4'-phosphopantetheinyl transferase family protein [Emergencia sp.]